MSSSQRAVAVCIVTHDSAADLPSCLAAVGALRHRPLEVVVVDCGSRDGSAEVAHREAPEDLPLTVRPLGRNAGFSGGMNAALELTDAPWVLALNPDARPDPDYLGRLLERIDSRPDLRVGAAVGRLVRPAGGGGRALLDACGMRLTLSWRHLDRGSERPDGSRWRRPERVFGATGAACLYRRAALDDAAIDGEHFLAEFHTFREDAELCFRLRERRWEIVYEPAARCEHRRAVTPARRRRLPPEVNYHSLKNRYLLRAYHAGPANLAMTLVPTLWRDALALAWVLLAERTSLAAYGWLWRHRRRIGQRRARIRARRLCGGWEVDRWFLRRGAPL